MNHSQKIITKFDGIIANCDSLVYYKVRWTLITNCDSFFITKCDTVYYKLRQVLQSAMIITNCDSTSLLQSAMDSYYKLRQLFYYKVRHGLLHIATGITKCNGFITNCNRCCQVGWLLQIATVQYFIRISDTESKPLKWLSLKRSRIVLVHRFRGNWSSKKFHIKFLTEYWLLLVTAKGPI